MASDKEEIVPGQVEEENVNTHGADDNTNPLHADNNNNNDHDNTEGGVQIVSVEVTPRDSKNTPQEEKNNNSAAPPLDSQNDADPDSGSQQQDGGGDAEKAEGEGEEEEDEETKTRNRRVKVIKFILSITFAIVTTFAIVVVAYVIALQLGTHSTSSLGEQLQETIAEVVDLQLERNLAPLDIFLKQVVDFIDENQLDVENFNDLQQLMPVAHSFLANYFDDSRCCFGAFINMQFPGDPGPVQPPGVLNCHAIERPDCPAGIPTDFNNTNAKWVGVLHYSNTYANHSGRFVQVLPRTPGGSTTNELYFKDYGDSVRMLPNGTETQIGFVPFHYGDGYWFHENVKYNLQKKEVRFVPVFPFDLYPPVVLKTHATTPLFKNGRRVGAMVTGFKLHFVTKNLAKLNIKKGMYTMLVERATGYIVATSSFDTQLISPQNTPIRALESNDTTARNLALKVYNQFGQNWTNVKPWKSNNIDASASLWDIMFPANTDDFIIAFDFKYLGLDWIGIIFIPRDSILGSLTANSIPLGIGVCAINLLVRLFSLGLHRFLQFCLIADAS